uniref:Uncharacterized protein n=1 Tax=Setaria italica TaxID=4555 RepID=K3ZKS2_SETIT
MKTEPRFKTNKKPPQQTLLSALRCRFHKSVLACSVQKTLGPSMRTKYYTTNTVHLLHLTSQPKRASEPTPLQH